MGWSGLIYAAIVAGWAAVLVPRWVRRNEEAERARAADVLAGVRVLERREPDPLDGRADRRRVLHAPHPPVPDLPPPRRASTPPVDDLRRRPASAGRRPPHSPAARRRRVLALLAAALTSTVAAFAAGVLPAVAMVAPAVLLLGFVVLTRRAVRRESRAIVSARVPHARRSTPRRAAAVRTAPAPAGTRDRARGDRHRVVARPVAEARPPSVRVGRVDHPAAAATAAGPAEADRAPGDELHDTDSWAPVPVPLPTYVTAPKAPRVIRRIDLSSSQAWTSGAPSQGGTSAGQEVRVGQPVAGPSAPNGFPELPPLLASHTADLDGADEPDVTSDDTGDGYERRRAVGD